MFSDRISGTESPRSSPEDSPSKPTSPEEKSAETTHDLSGISSPESLQSSDRLGWWLKHFLGSITWASTTPPGIWNEKATPLRRSIFQLKPLTARFGKTGFSSSAHAVAIPDHSPNCEDSQTLRSELGPILDLAYTEWLNGLPSGWISRLPLFPPSETLRYLQQRASSYEASLKWNAPF